MTTIVPGNNSSDYNKNDDFKTIVPFLADLAPQLNAEGDYLAFIEAYFKWLELPGNVLDVMYSYKRILDPSTGANNSKYTDLFRRETAPLYPLEMAASPKVLFATITDQYRRKGTIPSFDYFFRSIYNAQSEISFPINRKYFSAPATTNTDQVIRFLPTGTLVPSDYIGSYIKGNTSGATARIIDCKQVFLSGTVYNQAYIDNLIGLFNDYETFTDLSNSAISGTIEGLVSSFTIASGGSGYQAGSGVPFSFTPVGATTASAVVGTVLGTITSITVDEPGQGYFTAPIVEITGDGTGAVAHAVLTNGAVSSVVIDSAGSNYTYAYVKFQVAPYNTNTLASTFTAGTNSATFNVGSLPAVGQLVTFVGGTSETLEVHSVNTSTSVVTFTANAMYTHAASSGIDWAGDPEPTANAAAHAVITGSIHTILITDPGVGFTSTPTVNSAGITPGSGASITANIGPVAIIQSDEVPRFRGNFGVVPVQNYNVLFGMNAALSNLSLSGITGIFVEGEIVVDSTGNKTGTVVSFIQVNGTLIVSMTSGGAITSGTIKGSYSGATATVSSENGSGSFAPGETVAQVDTYGKILFQATVVSWDPYKKILVTSKADISTFDVERPIVVGTVVGATFTPTSAPNGISWSFGSSYSHPLLIDSGDGDVNTEYTYYIKSGLAVSTYGTLLREDVHPAGLNFVGVVAQEPVVNTVGVYESLAPAVPATTRIDYKNPNYPTGLWFREVQIITDVLVGTPFIESYSADILSTSTWFTNPLALYATKPFGLAINTPSDPSNHT